MELKKRVFVRKDPSGYEVWRETHTLSMYTAEEIRREGDDSPQSEEVSETIQDIEQVSGQTVTMESAYTLSGAYIGVPEVAYKLCNERGIAPELCSMGDNVCSIGFCEKEQKWFGWSHRAIASFGIGDVAEEGDCECSSGWTDDYLAEHPEEDLRVPVGFEAKTLEDAKRMAVAFADSVG